MRGVARLVYLVVLGGIVGANLVVAGRNAVVHPYTRTATSACAAAVHSSVERSFGAYCLLRAHLRGRTVVVPGALASHAWFFERVARLQVEGGDAPAPLDLRLARRLRKRAQGVLYLRGGAGAYVVYYLETRGARRYRFVPSEGGDTYYLMSDELYRREVEAAR